MKSLLAPVSFVIFNGSTTLATNVRIHITQPKLDGLVFLDSSDYPEKPRYSGIGPVSPAFRGFQNAFDQIGTYLEDIGEDWEITIKLGNIQPGAKEWSDVFYVGAAQPCTLKLAPIIYADNLSNPLQLQLELSLTPQERPISLDELISIADIEANR